MRERLGTLPTEVQITKVREGSESFPIESQTMDVGEGSRSVLVEISVTEIREGSGLGAGIGMDKLLNIAQSVKNGISHKNLDYLLKMDMDKLRRLAATVQPLILSKKRSINKKIREIMTQFDNIETLEQAQLLSLLFTQKKLQEALKLLGVNTTSKKRKFSSMQTDLIENVKQGLRNIGKHSQTKDKSMAKKSDVDVYCK